MDGIGRFQQCWLEPTNTLAGECGLIGMQWNGKEYVGLYCDAPTQAKNLAGVLYVENGKVFYGKEYLNLDCDLN